MHIFRCIHCRAQNKFRKPWGAYKRTPLCKNCGSLTRHRDKAARVVDPRYYPDRQALTATVCRCGGYPWPHRPKSRCCDLHPLAPYYRALRAGEDPDSLKDLLIDLQIEGPGVEGGDEPPF